MIPGSFTITIDGKTITPPPEGQPDFESRVQATIGDAAAVMTTEDGLIACNGWYLSRYYIEDLSLNPKHVYWLSKDRAFSAGIPMINLDLGLFSIKLGGADMIQRDGVVYVTLLPGMGTSKVTVNTV